MTNKLWTYQCRDLVTNLTQWRQVVLKNRGWQMADLSNGFEGKNLSATKVKLKASEVKKAIERIKKAKKQSQKVLIFGDYDVDGTCATAIAWLGLKQFGIKAIPFIPHRLQHGYGMSKRALEEIFTKNKPDLIITVDNGINALAALEFCRENEVEVIVTDHHLAPAQSIEVLPVQAVLQTPVLSGAGVAWFLVTQLLNDQKLSDDLLDLVALATIVDQVPQEGVNRQIVRAGFERLRQTKRPGILSLLQSAEIEQRNLCGRDIGFGLGPRINAIGRLTNTLEALRLLCTEQAQLAKQLAKVLDEVNHNRQQLTSEMIEIAKTQIEPNNLDKIMVVASEQFHEGIIGLIASKLVECFSRPAIVLALNGEAAKASARSIPGINITEFIGQFRSDLIDMGGHALAAGFSVKKEKLESLKQKIKKQSDKQIKDEQLVARILIEAPVSLAVFYDEELEMFLDQLEPFGAGNPEIVAQATGRVQSWQLLGNEQQHLKINLIDETGKFLPVLFWNFVSRRIEVPQKDQLIKAVGEVKLNKFRGKIQPQIFGQDWKVMK